MNPRCSGTLPLGRRPQNLVGGREEALIPRPAQPFEAFGGVSLVTTWHNPKTAVLGRKGDLIVWNPIFGQVALDYQFAPELC